MLRPVSRSLALAAALCALAAAAVWAQVVRNGPLPQPLPLFPNDNWWNVDITNAPVDPNSATYINSIGANVGMHPDFGGEADTEPEIYGIPFISVPGSQALRTVTWTDFGDQSDDGAPCRPVGYPIPDEAITQDKWIEGGYSGDTDPNDPDGHAEGDRHMLIVDRDHNLLFELYRTFWNSGSNRWEADSGAIFPLDYNRRRPEGWTSAEAAGLAILPGLVRYDEAYEGTEPIRHAIRFTTMPVHGYVFPASHDASTTADPAFPPLGARLRLKPGKVISNPSNDLGVARIAQAMKTYGLILADNGSDMYFTGTYDTRWDNGILNPAFSSLKTSDFDVIQLGWRPADHPVTREQFAVHMLRVLENRCYDPPDPVCGGGFYTDVPCPADPYAQWIEDLRDRGVVSGCSPGLYCPKNALSHAQLAMYLVRAKHAPGYTPPDCATTSPYTDFDCAHPFADWIMRAHVEGLLFGCTSDRFCPDDGVDRIQLEQLLANSFYQP